MLKFNAPSEEWTDEEWAEFTVWLSELLHGNEVTVDFNKKDGTNRVMRCTLKPELLPKVELTENKKTKKKSENTLAVFDLDKQEWRSFTIKSINRIKFES